MKYCLFQWRKEIIRFYSDKYPEISKDKIETSLFAVKLYDFKNNLYAKSYCSGNPRVVAM